MMVRENFSARPPRRRHLQQNADKRELLSGPTGGCFGAIQVNQYFTDGEIEFMLILVLVLALVLVLLILILILLLLVNVAAYISSTSTKNSEIKVPRALALNTYLASWPKGR